MRLYACLAAGVMPDGSQDSWAGNQDQTTNGANRAMVNGKKTESTVTRITAILANEAYTRGRNRWLSRILDPCQEPMDACAMQVVIVNKHARAMF